MTSHYFYCNYLLNRDVIPPNVALRYTICFCLMANNVTSYIFIENSCERNWVIFNGNRDSATFKSYDDNNINLIFNHLKLKYTWYIEISILQDIYTYVFLIILCYEINKQWKVLRIFCQRLLFIPAIFH